MLGHPTPELPLEADEAECQRVFSTVLAVSASSLPNRSKLKWKNPDQHRNGELGSTSRWDTPEKREAGIIQVTTTWKNQVKSMHWPTLRGQLSIGPKVWTLGTRARIDAARKQGKWRLAFSSILGTGDMNASAVEDVQCTHPITGDPGSGLWIYSSFWRPPWVPFKYEHCFKSLGAWYDTTASADGTQLALITKELHAIIRQVHLFLERSGVAKVAYYGGVSQWSLDDTKRLDILFAQEYNDRISKNMLASPNTNRSSNPLLLVGADSRDFPTSSKTGICATGTNPTAYGDHYTRWAADSIMRRGSTSLPDGTISLSKVRPGYWISSLIEYSLEGNSVLATGTPPPSDPACDCLLAPTWRAGLAHYQLKFLHQESFNLSTTCLPWMPATLVHCGPTPRFYPRGSPTFSPRSTTSTPYPP
eukprot:gene69-biopygen66